VVVKHTKLEHPGGIYIYRVHNKKLNKFCSGELSGLKSYLGDMFESCPDSYFGTGPRGSALKFSSDHTMVELTGHRVCSLAENGLKVNAERFKCNHSKVQLFMLENDYETVAIEVPIWLNAEEIPRYQELFGSSEPLTGHIDLLTIEDGKIWVWDYKPNAHKEKYADTQVYFYSLMLSKRTGIPLEKFRCGYFDWDRAYMFKPESIETKELNSSLKNF
jgi:hypothetical protein